MKGIRRAVMILAPVVVVIVVGELHAHLIGHYSYSYDGTQRFLWSLAYMALLEFFAYVSGAFDIQRTEAGVLWASVGAVAGGAAAISLIQLALDSLLLPRIVVGGSAIALLPIYFAVGHSAKRAQSLGAGEDRVLAVIGPQEAAALEADIDRAPERSVRLVRILHPSRFSARSDQPSLNLANEVEAVRATVIVLDRDAQADEGLIAQAAELHGLGLRIRTLTVFYDEWLGKLPVAELERLSLMFDIQELHAPAYARTKRVIDLTFALVGVVLVIVFIPIVWIADRIANPGPLFFRQTRIGKGGHTFTILKFRTMPPGRGESEWTAEDDPRLGTVGRWMRRVHVDELPQVINILRGELSLVGPRPEQPRYVAELTEKIPFYDVRHLVLPGVTGWAQVKFPYGASVEDALEKLQYEFYYLRHQGPVLDGRILARTVRTLVALKGR